MKVFLITKYLIKGSLNNKKLLILYILLPLLCLLLPLLVFNTPEKNKGSLNLSIVDMDNSKQSNELIKLLKRDYSFSIYITDLNTAREHLILDKTCAVLVIPENFQQNLLNKKLPKIELLYLKEKEEISIINNVINNYLTNLNLLAAADNPNLYNNLNTPSVEIFLKDTFSHSSDRTFKNCLGLMILFMIVLVNTSFAGFLTDKKTNNLSRVIRSGLTSSHYLTSYILFSLMLSSFQSGLLLFLLKTFNVHLELSYPELIFLFILIIMVSTAFGTLSISFCKNEDEIAILNAVIVFPTCMISGCLWPMEIMSNFFQNLSLIFPQRHILIVMDFLQGNVNFNSILIETTLISLTCFLFIALSFLRINSRGWEHNI